jgi:hypothetical protein
MDESGIDHELLEAVGDTLYGSDAFRRNGLDYYIGGRLSALHNLMLPSGILLHQAMEMLLKSHLRMGKPYKELKARLHNISALWDDFKVAVQDDCLSEFDSLVTQLNRWHQYLRYPDSHQTLENRNGIVTTFSIHRPAFEPKVRNGNLFYFCLEDFDAFFRAYVVVTRLNPEYVRALMRTHKAISAYEVENRHLIWDIEPPPELPNVP